MAAKGEYFKPKTGENHGIFGYKYSKFHRMKDPKWAAGDKIIQYVGIAKVFDRNCKLQTLKTILSRRNKQHFTRAINKTLSNNTGYLRTANIGDAQRIRNIFQGHSEILRAYQPLMIEEIVSKIDQRTFLKRKTFNQLVYRLKFLSESYERELIKISDVQNRKKIVDPQELYEENEKKSYELELRNVGARVRAVNHINRVYDEIIHVMLKDSIYYDPVLTALQADLIEQNRFLHKTRNTGIPTMKNVQSLQQEFEEIDKRTSMKLADRINALLEHREILNTNNRRVKTLVRRDSEFDVNPSRYDRDTCSIVDLKIQVEEIEKIIKQLQKTTSCGIPKEIYLRVKEQVCNSEKIKKNSLKQEHRRNIAQISKDIAEMSYDELANDFTYDEMRRLDSYRSLEKDVQAQKSKQNLLLERKSDFKNISDTLKSALQHMLHVVRNFENGIAASEEQNRASLLDFNLALRKPTKLYPGDVDTLISTTKLKFANLMKIYHDVDFNTTQEKLKNLEYRNRTLNEYTEKEMKSIKEIEKSVMEGMEIDDPTVFNRKQIKTISANIVMKNMKQDV